MTKRDRKLLSLICIVLGASVCAIAFDWLPYDPEKIHAPDWVIAMAGGVFVAGGLAIAFRQSELLVCALGNLIVIAFAAIALWVALYGPSAQFSGGIPFLPHETNLTLARIVFAASAVMCALILLPGLKQLYALLQRPTDAGTHSTSMPERE